MGKLSDYYSYNGFFTLLHKTKKYRELWQKNDAPIPFGGAIITTGVLWYLFETIPPESLNNLLKNILITLSAGLIGFLGFLVSGLAILTGVITYRVLEKLDKEEKINYFVGILYSFYFEGGIIGFTIFGFLISYLIIHIELETIRWLFITSTFFLSYIFWYSIAYAIGLIGTCINIFFVNAYYNMEIANKQEKEQSGENQYNDL